MAKERIIEAGEAWYAERAAHVDRMIATDNDIIPAIEPAGSDALHPELWKDIHWVWFFENREPATD